MNQIRGVVLILLGLLVILQGWRTMHGSLAYSAYALGLLALAVGLWRLSRKGR